MTTDTKVCTKCGETKPVTDYYKTRGWYVNECKECSKKRVKGDQERNPRRVWATSTRASHKRQGYNIKVSIDDIVELANKRDTCAMCHRPITYGSERLEGESKDRVHSMHSATLDRVNNEDTLTKDNIEIICYECNARKADWTPDKLRNFTKVLEEYVSRSRV